ncbi:hypothetical protein ACNF42_07860 [Cuniculiplasma sp. SKW3]|uniref:hypothetical protein n=1 Tax=Cuniculiplasma sp. SKW3 TaxID=3400170 RepID=UPI003FD0F583
MDNENILKLLKEIREDIKNIMEHMNDRYYVLGVNGARMIVSDDKRIMELLQSNQYTLNYISSSISPGVRCPKHNVPMVPILEDDGYGNYKICFEDNKDGGHKICPKC